MPFPFVAPLKEWVVKKLKERESDRNYITTLSPFAMMSSGAVVMKNKTSDEIKQLFATQQYGNDSTTYYGCVITNTTDVSKLYQTGDTIVGYDLNGKEIKVEGEKNRRVSTPIIESIEIDTDGGNNTLKTAQVKVKVFTLKQLEMFELFFLRPSMNVVLEYGWGTDIRNKSKKYTIDSKLFAKKNFKQYKEDYSAVFLNVAKKKTEYLQTLSDLEGEYDYMVGKVTSFTYSPETDGSYNVNIEVSSGNELQLWPAIKSAKSSNTTSKKNKTPITNYESFIKRISSDLGIPSLATKNFAKKSDWEKEFFNYGIVNDTQKNTIVSKTPYISMKAIIEIINSIKLFKYSDQDGISITYNDDKGNPIIPVNSNPNLISTNEYVIFPGRLPKIDVSSTSIENGVVLFHENDKRINGSINGKSFNIDNTPIYDWVEKKPIDNKKDKFIKDLDTNTQIKIKSNTGNLLNVFFSYDRFLEIFNNGNSIADIINPVLQTISDAMLGLVNLELQKPTDTVNFTGLEIIDRKISQPLPKEEKNSNNAPYRFKIGAKESIIQNFSFNMEMSTLMQAQALYSSQLAIAKQNNKTKTDASKEIDNYVSADLSYAKNADGYFSVNDMEVEIVKKSPKTNTSTDADDKSRTEMEKELRESIQSKYVKFKVDGKMENLIYKDSGLVQLYILPKSPAQSMALTYLDISIEIDGLAGFSCGEYFQIDGIPEIYNKNGYFQITNVKQGIDSNGWKTTIEAGYLLKTE